VSCRTTNKNYDSGLFEAKQVVLTSEQIQIKINKSEISLYPMTHFYEFPKELSGIKYVSKNLFQGGIR